MSDNLDKQNKETKRVMVNRELVVEPDFFSSNTRRKTPEGYLRANAGLVKTGILEFGADELGVEDRGDEIINVYFPDDSVFSTGTLDSAEMKPVTLGHPSDFVDSDNYRQHAVGHLGNDIYPYQNTLIGSVMITDQTAIDAISEGIAETSIGYYVNIVPKSGVYNGINYDYTLTGPIEVNHLAIVETGRAGETIRIYNQDGAKMKTDEFKKVLDEALEKNIDEFKVIAENAAKEAVKTVDETPKESDSEDTSHPLLMNVNIDADAIAQAVADKASAIVIEAFEVAQEAAQEASEQSDAEEITEEEVEEKVEEEEDLVEATNTAIKEQAKARMLLINKVSQLVADPDKLYDLETDREIIEAAFENSKEETESKSDDYLIGKIDSLVSNRERATTQRRNIANNVNTSSAIGISAYTPYGLKQNLKR